MADLDLDDFIAQIEESAPQELVSSENCCQECHRVLECVDGNFICSHCGAQATHILELEQTEILYDESGRAIAGARVADNSDRKRSKPKHSIEYGWAWSTDEAIAHILMLQIKGLERAFSLPSYFRDGVKNMWFKYWIDYVGPYIKDEYNEADLIAISVQKALKYRDLEVLVKVRDKVMIPEQHLNDIKSVRKHYKMMGSRFMKDDQSGQVISNEDTGGVDSSPDEAMDPANRSLVVSAEEAELDHIFDENSIELNLEPQQPDSSNSVPAKPSTRVLSIDNISLLTLDRTLAFLEASARCLNLAKPFFASDIVRACNQRLIPFFGAHHSLPEGIKLNRKDRYMFQKSRPPNPYQLSRAANLLIHKIYPERMPATLPVPDLNRILDRFVTDLNLPFDIMDHIKGELDFSTFPATQPFKLSTNFRWIRRYPQYDRWAFAILICSMKKFFGLDDASLCQQYDYATVIYLQSGEHIFIVKEWMHQISMRLHLVLSYDPLSIFHPMAQLSDLRHTPQMFDYVERILNDRAIASTRVRPSEMQTDESFRTELTDFLKKEMPRPSDASIIKDDVCESAEPVDVWHPITDALNRTKRYWEPDIAHDPKLHDLLTRDLSCCKVMQSRETDKSWSIYEKAGLSSMKDDIPAEWPYCFKLLIHIGAYLCYCEPKELLKEIRVVEEFLWPHNKVLLRRPSRCRRKSTTVGTNEKS